MVFPRASSIPPGLPEPVIPPPDVDSRTTRAILLDVEKKLDALLEAMELADPEDEEPEALTLDGEPAGKARDQTQSLG